MHLLTPKGVSQKLSLTIHFLEHKQAEFEHLENEIASFKAEVSQQQSRLGDLNGTTSDALPEKTRNSESSEGATV